MRSNPLSEPVFLDCAGRDLQLQFKTREHLSGENDTNQITDLSEFEGMHHRFLRYNERNTKRLPDQAQSPISRYAA